MAGLKIESVAGSKPRHCTDCFGQHNDWHQTLVGVTFSFSTNRNDSCKVVFGIVFDVIEGDLPFWIGYQTVAAMLAKKNISSATLGLPQHNIYKWLRLNNDDVHIYVPFNMQCEPPNSTSSSANQNQPKSSPYPTLSSSRLYYCLSQCHHKGTLKVQGADDPFHGQYIPTSEIIPVSRAGRTKEFSCHLPSSTSTSFGHTGPMPHDLLNELTPTSSHYSRNDLSLQLLRMLYIAFQLATKTSTKDYLHSPDLGLKTWRQLQEGTVNYLCHLSKPLQQLPIMSVCHPITSKKDNSVGM